jgi:hypothetical protein
VLPLGEGYIRSTRRLPGHEFAGDQPKVFDPHYLVKLRCDRGPYQPSLGSISVSVSAVIESTMSPVYEWALDEWEYFVPHNMGLSLHPFPQFVPHPVVQ